MEATKGSVKPFTCATCGKSAMFPVTLAAAWCNKCKMYVLPGNWWQPTLPGLEAL